MELHQAFKYIIRSEGSAILNELRLVNILNDLNAYQDIQGAKYMVRAIIEDGYSDKFVQIGALNTQANDLIRKFHSTTGFNQDSIERIFNSIAFGLGWITQMPVSPSSPTQNQPTKPTTSSSTNTKLNLRSSQLEKKSDSFIQQYKENAEDYLDSVIEIKGSSKQELGVEIKAFSFYDTGDGSMSIHFEINGSFKVKLEYYITIKAIVYGLNGRILDTIETSINKKELKKSFLVKETGWVYENALKCVANISKILIYWEID